MSVVVIQKDPKTKYRLVRGLSYEGISIREIYYDETGRLVGWSQEPLSPLAPTAEELRQEIINSFKELDDMLEATKEPVLDEIDLELECGV